MLNLTPLQQEMLDGEHGAGTQVAMEIIVALGKIYEAKSLIPVESTQISGVSYMNIGEAGVEFLEKLARGNARARIKAMLNPCGLDLKDWEVLGFREDFYKNQIRVIDAYKAVGIEPTCTCTPYLIGIAPQFGTHVAWSESSAVSYVNSVLGARTNREGGPSALCAAITGFTANYGLHLSSQRVPNYLIKVECEVKSYEDFALLGIILGRKLKHAIPLIQGLNPRHCLNDNLKQLGASMAATGAVALYHMEGITPESRNHPEWIEKLESSGKEMVILSLDEINEIPGLALDKDAMVPVDLVFFGCPHASSDEIIDILKSLKHEKVKTRVWIATARALQERLIQDSDLLRDLDENVHLISDTCIVVSPLSSLNLKNIVTNSGKAYYYLNNKKNINVKLVSTRECIDAAINGMIKK
ncbi:MAG: aconitase X catalytic domain-containing protein [Promethearchaeota archaeon]